MNIETQQEQSGEFEQVEELVREAFPGEEFSDQTEHLLVKRLRKSEAFIPELSLVAKMRNDEIIGHILLSKAHILEGARAV